MKKAIFITCLLLFITVTVFAQTAATVNLIKTEQITVKQLRADVQRMESVTGRPLSKDERMQVLDALINELLVMQAAERDKIVVTENEITQQIQQARITLSQNVGREITEAEFAQAVRSEYQMDMQEFREQTRRQLIVQKYLMQKKGDQISSVTPPTDAEIASEYNLLRTNLVRPQTVRLSMIQVPYGNNRNQARELANRLMREIGTDPSKFDEVSARSLAPNSGYQGGDFGYLPLNAQARELVGQAIIDAAFKLNQGQVSSLIEGPHGFNIIKVTESYAQKNLELDDLIQPGTRVTVREYIGQGLLAQRQSAALQKASEELVEELRRGRTFQIFENNINW